MNLIKRCALCVLALFAFAAFGTASASAATDTATLTVNNGTPCAIEYDYNSTVPGSATLTNLDNPNACSNVDVNNAASNLTLNFTGSASSGTATLSGVLGLSVGGPLFGCRYDTTFAGGSGALTGTHTGNNFTVTGALWKKSGSFGLFGCIGSVPDLGDVVFSGTINP